MSSMTCRCQSLFLLAQAPLIMLKDCKEAAFAVARHLPVDKHATDLAMHVCVPGAIRSAMPWML